MNQNIKRLALASLPVAAVLSTAAVVHGQGAKHQTTVKSQTVWPSGDQKSADKPQVYVNGHHVDVPDNGTTTLKQGDTQTTVSHQADQAGDKAQTNTSSNGDSVNISVTSNASGDKSTHNHVFYNVNSSSNVTTHTSVDTSSRGTGSVNVH